MYDSIRSIIYELLRHQNNWCQYCGESALTGNGAKGTAVIFSPTPPHPTPQNPITAYWTHTRLNSNKRASAEGATFHALLWCGWVCQKPPKKEPRYDYRGLDNVHVDVEGYSQLNCYTLLCLCRTWGCVRSLARRLSSSSSSVFCTLFCPPPPLPQSRMKAQGIDARWLDVLT